MQLSRTKFRKSFILSSKNGLSASPKKIRSIRGKNLVISLDAGQCRLRLELPVGVAAAAGAPPRRGAAPLPSGYSRPAASSGCGAAGARAVRMQRCPVTASAVDSGDSDASPGTWSGPRRFSRPACHPRRPSHRAARVWVTPAREADG